MSFLFYFHVLTSSNEHSAYVTFKEPQGAETAVLLSVGSLLFSCPSYLNINVVAFNYYI